MPPLPPVSLLCLPCACLLCPCASLPACSLTHMYTHTQAFLIDGMESQSQAKVGSALQVFFNLEELNRVSERERE